MPNITPLRYPGGKACLAPYLERLLAQNHLEDAHYVEPFCGGCGLALELLMNYSVSTVHLNDYDKAIFAFWNAAVRDTDALCQKIDETPCNMDVWHEQRAIYRARADANQLDLAFATFFLNRTNRSGIIEAGVIGGKAQAGTWKMDARYNRTNLIERIRSVGRFRSRIKLYNLDALDFLRQVQPELPDSSLVYLDPPYVEKGPGLYLNSFEEEDHRALADWVRNELKVPWMVSYDDHPLIAECYSGFSSAQLSLAYSAYGNARRGSEVVYFSDRVIAPDMGFRKSKFRQPWSVEPALAQT